LRGIGNCKPLQITSQLRLTIQDAATATLLVWKEKQVMNASLPPAAATNAIRCFAFLPCASVAHIACGENYEISLPL
jgi:hypothetical protein